ncbi:autotransporter domain-containing protein [Mesorhizobium sp. CCNWLW179-1]|uniref:autotransporter outer membrane beta-barrel domain-containing protein n=1 Tax=unclassified Mesorhizobium TaxID=325217 RepID=UPI00301461C0
MRAHFRTKFLAATTAMPTAILPTMSLGVGLAVGSAAVALADEPTMIPLEYVKEKNGDFANRLGIWAAINNGKAQRYIFDTGSEQLNTQIGSEVTGVRPVTGRSPYVYTYGNSTYGYKLRTVEIDKLTYSDPNDLSKTIDVPAVGNGKYKVGKILDFIYSQGYSEFDKIDPENAHVDGRLRDVYGEMIKDEYFADLNQRRLMNQGEMAEEGGKFAGTFGAGDYLFNSSVWGMMGSATQSGYIVSANTDYTNSATPGCSPCTIINLNPSLRTQFTSVMPWGNQNRYYFQSKFSGSNANASTLFEGNYDFQFTAVEGQKPISEKAAALLDTGSPGRASVTLSKAKFEELRTAGVKFKEIKDGDGKIVNYIATIPSLTIAAPDGTPVELDKINVAYGNDGAKETTVVVGLDFFLSQSVVYDLAKQTTAYTPYFVSANNFTTDAPTAGELQLSKISAKMGSQWQRDKLDADGQPVLGKDGKPVRESFGQFGIAGVISGAGDLTIESSADVRMTNINTYSGATDINGGASLSLPGLGSIERSARVVADGTLDISDHGNANPYWGISDAYNDARIRSLSGTGAVLLGDRTLVLTAANDSFAGSITDLDDEKKHGGGALLVAGGVQTLSGKNDYAGMTTVSSGAGLLLTDTGAITHDVTASGFLGNDGQIGGIAQADDSGVVAGAGSFNGVVVGDGGMVAPGSALDPNKAVARLTVTGDFTQQAGSIYQAGLAKSSDLIDVGGSAAIDSSAQIELIRQGTASIDTRYTLLTAAGGVNGTYGGLTGGLYTDSPFVDFELAYDPTNIYLDVDRSAVAYADVGNTFNQRSVGAAAEALGSINPIHDNILFLTGQESRNAFDLLSGEIHASIHSAFVEDSHFVRDAAGERIRAAFSSVGASTVPVMAYGPEGPELAPATSENFAVWGSGFGAWGHLDGDDNAARLDRSTGGFIAGGDAAIGESWRLGLLAGYSHTSIHVDDRASSGSSNNYHLGLYAGTQRGPLGFRSGLVYTWHRIETGRSVAFADFSDSLSADYHAGTFQAFGELGYRIDKTSVSFEPYANLAYVNFSADRFSEDGGAAALSGKDRSSDTTFTTIGLRASTTLTLGSVSTTARGGIGWRHAFGDVIPETAFAFTGGSSFAVEGTPITKNAAVIEAGLDVKLTDKATIGLAYQGQLASDAQEHGFNAKLGVRF